MGHEDTATQSIDLTIVACGNIDRMKCPVFAIYVGRAKYAR